MSWDDERLSELAELAEAGLAAATLVHELRQPVFALRAMAQIGVEDGALRGDQLTGLLEVVEHLDGLLGSWGEVGRRDPPRLYDAAEVVRSVGRLLASRVRLAGAHLDLGDDAPVWAHGSPSAAWQVTLNLVQNALDAVTGADVRRIEVRAVSGGGRVEVVVTDTGPGLAPEVIDRLFQPFVTSKGRGGTGLGLWVARRLCAQAGGSLALEPAATGGVRAVAQVGSPPEGDPGGPMKYA